MSRQLRDRLTDDVSRREFIAAAAKAALGVGIAPLATGTLASASSAGTDTRRASSVIYINLMGGMSQLDTFDLKPEKPQIQGPIDPIATNCPGIIVSQHLPFLAANMDKLAVIRSMTSNQGAHPEAQYLLHRSYLQRGTISHPTLAAWVMMLAGKANHSIPGSVSIASNKDSVSSGFLDPKFAPVPLGDPDLGLPNSRRPEFADNANFDKRLSMARLFNQQFRDRYHYRTTKAHGDMFEEAVRLMKSEDLVAFDIAREPAEIQREYGKSSFGKGCLLARRLVEHGVRFVEVGLGGWDTHYDNFDGVAKLARQLDRSLAALLVDLARRGMLEDTLVVVGTEFGRTPQIIKAHKNGRDHYPNAFTCLIAGGGVAGGQTYGATDDRGADVIDSPVTIADLNATIAWATGLPWEDEFTAPNGQKFHVADEGSPVTALFS